QLQLHFAVLQGELAAMQERGVAQLDIDVLIVGLRLVCGKNQIDNLSHGHRTVAANDQLFVAGAFKIALDRLPGERAEFNRFRLGGENLTYESRCKDYKEESTKNWHGLRRCERIMLSASVNPLIQTDSSFRARSMPRTRNDKSTAEGTRRENRATFLR